MHDRQSRAICIDNDDGSPRRGRSGEPALTGIAGGLRRERDGLARNHRQESVVAGVGRCPHGNRPRGGSERGRDRVIGETLLQGRRIVLAQGRDKARLRKAGDWSVRQNGDGRLVVVVGDGRGHGDGKILLIGAAEISQAHAPHQPRFADHGKFAGLAVTRALTVRTAQRRQRVRASACGVSTPMRP